MKVTVKYFFLADFYFWGSSYIRVVSHSGKYSNYEPSFSKLQQEMQCHALTLQ